MQIGIKLFHKQTMNNSHSQDTSIWKKFIILLLIVNFTIGTKDYVNTTKILETFYSQFCQVMDFTAL
jgi:hypothetical protein